MKKFLKEFKYSIVILLILVFLYLPSFLNPQNVDFNRFLYNKYLTAFIIGFIISGIVADFLTSIIMKKVWDKTTESYKEILRIKNPSKKVTDKDVPFWLHGKNRRPFIWAPRLIGIVERFFYTTAIIFNQFGLIGIWLVFKAIGNWNDFSLVDNKGDKNIRSKNYVEEGTTRIRPNNFIIGTGVTLIFGILGGVLFRIWLDPHTLIEVIENSYNFSK